MIRNKKTIILCASLVLIILFCLLTIRIVPTGYVGVRTTFGQIDETPVKPGLVFKAPIAQRIIKVNTKQQDKLFKDKVWSETSSRTAVYFENITVTYSLDPDKAVWLVSNVTDYKNAVVPATIVQSSVKRAAKEFNDTDVTNRGKIESLSGEYLQQALTEKYGEGTVVIHRLVVANADFDEDYNQAIAEKQRATLQAETQRIENQKNIEKAQADAEVAKTQAEASAEVTRIKAEAEAEANDLISKSITSEVLENKRINKWNGEMPKYIGSGNESILVGEYSDDKGEDENGEHKN